MAALFSRIISSYNILELQPEPTIIKPELKPTVTYIIDHQSHQLFNAAKSYLDSILVPNDTIQLELCTCDVTGRFIFTMGDNQSCEDKFEGIAITWKYVSNSYHLSFCEEHYHRVVSVYFQCIADKFEEVIRKTKDKDKDTLYTTTTDLVIDDEEKVRWGDGSKHVSITTFDNFMIDEETKKIVIDDLDRLIAGEVGKRGYLLFGSRDSLGGGGRFLAAMSNYLGYRNFYRFNIDNFKDEDDLKILLTTPKKSVLMCNNIHLSNEPKMTMSRFLKFLDGLSPSSLEERIIVSTTVYKDQMDQSLFLPGGVERHVRKTFYARSCYARMAPSWYARMK